MQNRLKRGQGLRLETRLEILQCPLRYDGDNGTGNREEWIGKRYLMKFQD